MTATQSDRDDTEALVPAPPSPGDIEITPRPAVDSKADGKDKKKAPALPAERVSATMRAIENEEEQSLKAWLDTLGEQGAFAVQLTRTKPAYVRVDGKDIDTKGYLDIYDHSLTEDDIRRTHGGGTYHLKITRPNQSGAYVYAKHRTITIAGDPKTDRLPGHSPPAATAASSSQAASGDSPAVIKMALDSMAKQLDRADRAEPRGIDPAIQVLLDEMRRQSDQKGRELDEMRRELSAIRNKPVETDPIKDKLLGTLLDGQHGHVTALRSQHETEIRQLKQSAADDIKRIEDRHDRGMADLRSGHDRTITELRSSHDREIRAIQHAADVAAASTQASNGIQVKILEGSLARFERDNAKLETEVAALREKKDKPLIEQLKEINTLKEALGGSDEDGSAWSKLADLLTNPEAIGTVIQMVKGKPDAPAAAGQRQAAQAQVQPAKPQIYRNRQTGEASALMPNGALVPVKKRPKVVPLPDGTQLTLPDVDPAQIAVVISYLERAFQSRTDPIIVAQSAKPQVPEPILAWIQANDTDQTSGVDLFLSKVAQLPSSSPLASVAGRTWVRKVGKALIGSQDPEQ